MSTASAIDNKISVIAPVYCPNQHLINLTEKLFLESLAKSTVRKDLEIIIVDDASPKKDELKSMIETVSRKKDLNIKYFRNEINQGLATSINLGVGKSTSPYLLLTNNDIYAPAESIRRLLALLKSDKHYGATGPILSFAFSHKVQEVNTGITLNDFSGDEYRKIDLAAENISTKHDGKITLVNSLVGCFLMMPRVVFEKAGGIDENYRLGYHEESDLLVRVKKQGYKLVVDHSTFVFHGDIGIRNFYGPSMNKVKGKATYNLLRNYAYFTFKNGCKELFLLLKDYKPRI